MRVALIGDFAARSDEGLKNIAKGTYQCLKNDLDTIAVDLRGASGHKFYRTIREFRPDLIHYLVGNTMRGLMLASVLRRLTRVPLVVSITHTGESPTLRGERGARGVAILKTLRPSLALVQSPKTGRVLAEAGWRTAFLPNGVDCVRFQPISQERRDQIRQREGYSRDDIVVLHVGHVTAKRNLEALIPLAERGLQVHVIASNYQGVDVARIDRLRGAGLRIDVGYSESLAEFYGMADVYAFPVPTGKTILMPLSVMEAMACNRPVVSVSHEGLSTFFNEGDGLAFSEPEDFLSAVDRARAQAPRTRQQVEGLDWAHHKRALVSRYTSLIQGDLSE